jgi:hypothetical protein
VAGKSFDLVSCSAQGLDATVFLSSELETKIGKFGFSTFFFFLNYK